MTYSREQLVGLALSEMGIAAAGQTPSAEDYAEVDGKMNSVMDDLALRDVYTWGDPDQTEDAAALHLATILAQASARAFGQIPDETARLLAESRLRGLKRIYVTGQPQKTEYF